MIFVFLSVKKRVTETSNSSLSSGSSSKASSACPRQKSTEQIKKKEAQIAGIKADQKTVEEHPKSENVFCGIEVFGKEYTDKKEACKSFAESRNGFYKQ